MTFPSASLCKLKSGRKDAEGLELLKIDDATLSASLDFTDRSQVGLQLFQSVKNTNIRRLALGYKRPINRDLTLKAKVDTGLNAAVFADYRVSTALGFQTTVAGNLNETKKDNGFLNSAISVGLKIKYDS